jgi:hypothetical protein
MNVASAGDQRAWRVVGGQSGVPALEVSLHDRTYVLPWSQFLYAEGGDDHVHLVFATHDVVVSGRGPSLLLTDAAAQRLVCLAAPPRAERFGNTAVVCVRELSVQKV